jgi:hypothetical protein
MEIKDHNALLYTYRAAGGVANSLEQVFFDETKTMRVNGAPAAMVV